MRESIIERRKRLAEELAWKQSLLKEYDDTDEHMAMGQAVTAIKIRVQRRSQIVRADLPRVQSELEVIEAMLMLEINGRVDEKGKAVASNAETRKALLTVELAKDVEYGGLVQERTKLQMELDTLECEIDAEQKRYAACRYSLERKLGMLKVLGL